MNAMSLPAKEKLETDPAAIRESNMFVLAEEIRDKIDILHSYLDSIDAAFRRGNYLLGCYHIGEARTAFVYVMERKRELQAEHNKLPQFRTANSGERGGA